MIETQFNRSEVIAALAIVIFSSICAILLLTGKQIVVGPQGTRLTIGWDFGPLNAGVFLLAGSIISAGAVYLIFSDRFSQEKTAATAQTHKSDGTTGQSKPDLLEKRRKEWGETAERLANAEEEIYRTIMEEDGVIGQSEIVEETSLSKATVSRTLDGLETKKLVERKKRGIGNLIVLK